MAAANDSAPAIYFPGGLRNYHLQAKIITPYKKIQSTGNFRSTRAFAMDGIISNPLDLLGVDENLTIFDDLDAGISFLLSRTTENAEDCASKSCDGEQTVDCASTATPLSGETQTVPAWRSARNTGATEPLPLHRD